MSILQVAEEKATASRNDEQRNATTIHTHNTKPHQYTDNLISPNFRTNPTRLSSLSKILLLPTTLPHHHQSCSPPNP